MTNEFIEEFFVVVFFLIQFIHNYYYYYQFELSQRGKMWFVPFLFGILVATIFLWTLRLFGHFEEIVHDFMTSIQNFNQFGLQQNSVMLNRTSTFSRMILGQGQLETPNVAFYENKIPAKPNGYFQTECLEQIKMLMF